MRTNRLLLAENISEALVDEFRGQEIRRVVARLRQNSTTSMPTIFLWSATARIREVTCTQSSPPGSGVPVAGTKAGSKPSRSIVR